MNFKKAQAISYDPKGIIHQRKCQIRCGIFQHEEVAGLAQWANSYEVNEEVQLIVETCQIQSESTVPMQSNPLTAKIQTPLIKEALHKRVHGEISAIEVEYEKLFMKQKVIRRV